MVTVNNIRIDRTDNETPFNIIIEKNKGEEWLDYNLTLTQGVEIYLQLRKLILQTDLEEYAKEKEGVGVPWPLIREY